MRGVFPGSSALLFPMLSLTHFNRQDRFWRPGELDPHISVHCSSHRQGRSPWRILYVEHGSCSGSASHQLCGLVMNLPSLVFSVKPDKMLSTALGIQ